MGAANAARTMQDAAAARVMLCESVWLGLQPGSARPPPRRRTAAACHGCAWCWWCPHRSPRSRLAQRIPSPRVRCCRRRCRAGPRSPTPAGLLPLPPPPAPPARAGRSTGTRRRRGSASRRPPRTTGSCGVRGRPAGRRAAHAASASNRNAQAAAACMRAPCALRACCCWLLRARQRSRPPCTRPALTAARRTAPRRQPPPRSATPGSPGTRPGRTT